MVTQHFKPPFWTPNEIPERNGYPRYPDTEMTRPSHLARHHHRP